MSDKNGGRVVKGIKQCRYCKWYVKDNFQCTHPQCTYPHLLELPLVLPDEACEHFDLRSKSMNKWIPVSERLPEAKYGESARLLVTKCWKEDEDTKFVDEAYFNGSYWCEPTGECITIAKVVAWMPLPEPYKEEQEHD